MRKIKVRKYQRRDGTIVRGHSRRSPLQWARDKAARPSHSLIEMMKDQGYEYNERLKKFIPINRAHTRITTQRHRDISTDELLLELEMMSVDLNTRMNKESITPVESDQLRTDLGIFSSKARIIQERRETLTPFQRQRLLNTFGMIGISPERLEGEQLEGTGIF